MATVDRVLPWRRNTEQNLASHLSPVVESYRKYHPKASTGMIHRAYDVAAEAHATQLRSSGESYIHHPLAVAKIVAEFGLDDITLSAALLHDAVEDTELSLDDLRRDFGEDVAAIVDGVTKLDRLQFDSREAQQAATMRKMLVAMAKDLRVLLIKLADRLHNMRTIASMSPDRQHRIAQETLDIYAPLAHRLGIQEVRQQLEDLAFSALHPKRFAELDHLVSERTPERDLSVAQAIATVRTRLIEAGVGCEVTGRSKHLWSVYEKMVVKGRDFDDIFDIVAVRVIAPTVKDCYAALGCIHGNWRPVVGRFKDYIAMPKFNLYQSLHTTVIGANGRPMEVQIRTDEMHRRAEWGVAAHWAYKAGGDDGDIDWLNRLVDWQAEVDDPSKFMEALKTDLDQDEVYVFTPEGRVVALPIGSTPIDFAYAVHTEVGHACYGAKVNGRLVALDSTLNSGDSCEILTSKSDDASPSQDWLTFVVSTRARNKIRQWFSRERRLDAIEEGREELTEEFRRERVPLQQVWTDDEFARIVEETAQGDLDGFLAAIGEGHQSARSVALRMANAFDPSRVVDAPPEEILSHRLRRDSESGVHVEGLEDLLVRLASCCTPVPGDPIIGFVTRGRGISVHRNDCANALGLSEEQSARLIDVDWDVDGSQSVVNAGVEVVALDRTNLLRDVANALGDHHVNIVSCETLTGDDRVAKMRFEFELKNVMQLHTVLHRIKAINSVYDAYRIIPGGSADDISE